MPLHPFALFVAVPIIVLTIGLVFAIRQSSLKKEEKKRLAGLPTTAVKRARFIGYWASSILFGAFFIIAGIPKLTEVSSVVHNFSNWGYSEEFLLFIGATELVAGIALIIPRTSLYAATYLGLIMGGAIYTHLAFDAWFWALLPATCLAFLSFIAFEDWQRRIQNNGQSVTSIGS